MRYSFCLNYNVRGEESIKSVEFESDSLINALKLLAFEAFRIGSGSDFILCPLYTCSSSRGDSARMLSTKNFDFFKKFYRNVCDVGVIIY